MYHIYSRKWSHSKAKASKSCDSVSCQEEAAHWGPQRKEGLLPIETNQNVLFYDFSTLPQSFTQVTCSNSFQIKVETVHSNGQKKASSSKAKASPATAADPQAEKVSDTEGGGVEHSIRMYLTR